MRKDICCDCGQEHNVLNMNKNYDENFCFDGSYLCNECYNKAMSINFSATPKRIKQSELLGDIKYIKTTNKTK